MDGIPFGLMIHIPDGAIVLPFLLGFLCPSQEVQILSRYHSPQLNFILYCESR